MSSVPDTTRAAPGLGKAFIAGYMLAYLGLWIALLTPAIVSIAIRIAELDPAHKESSLALVLGAGALVAMIANPVAGLLSDRTTAAFGMRRPWIVGGLVVGTAGTALIAGGSVMQMLAGWCLASLGFNAVLAALTAVLADQVPDHQRGKVSGLLGLTIQVAIVCGVGLAQAAGSDRWAMFMAPCAVAVVTSLLFCALLDDRRQQPGDLPNTTTVETLKSFWISPRAAPDFALAFASRFLLFVGLATLVNNQVYFLMERLGVAAGDVPGRMLTITLVSTAGTVLSSIVSGVLSDRIGRRKPFVFWAAALFGLGLLVIGHATDFATFLVGTAICGLGQGSYLAVDLALVTEVLPNKRKDAGKDMGVFNLASAMPQSIAPALAPLLLSIGSTGVEKNYGALFTAAAVFAIAGALAIVPIRQVR